MAIAARFSSVAVAILMVVATAATAADVKHGELMISDAWARASVVKNGAAYVTIMNHGTKADRLIKAASPVAAKVELHTHVMEGDVVRMRQVKAIEVGAQSHTELKPGGLHIMMMGLKQPLKEGEMVPLTLTFEKAGQVELMAHVRKAGAAGGHKMEQKHTH
ncbi:MAG: copper chaperone PCu(A)C [Alphaproteobacteria bacterium]|nr:copper chaperone PCu(A)C [Alphaproteobacteria bacterium]